MRNFRYSSKRRIRRNNSSSNNNSNRKTTVDLLRLIHHHLMSPQGRGHATFSRVNLEGSNGGSTMLLRRSGDSTDGCSINVYVNNNVQGVNNSILVGSRVMMRDPGVEFCLGDPTLDALGRRKQDKEAKTDSIWGGWRCVWLLFSFAIVVLMFMFV